MSFDSPLTTLWRPSSSSLLSLTGVIYYVGITHYLACLCPYDVLAFSPPNVHVACQPPSIRRFLFNEEHEVEPIDWSTSPPLPRGFTYDEEPSPQCDHDVSVSADNTSHASAPSSFSCAPEINNWTTLMTSGTNAAIHRPGAKMTLQEGMEILYNDLKDLSSYDYDMIEGYWDTLLPLVSFLGSANAEKVKQALTVAYRAHRGQMRKSGEPFIIHPVEVAVLLSGMKMDVETVMAGLLHDTVEDTELTFEQVEAMFGHEVRSIVEGETKVSKLPKLAFAEYADEQAENLRQMFIAMTDDYRIIIVKVGSLTVSRLLFYVQCYSTCIS